MKLLRVTTALLAVVTVNAHIFSSNNPIDTWDLADLKQYLKDNSVQVDPKATTEQIKELSKKQWQLHTSKAKPHAWYHPKSLKQQVLGVYGDYTNQGYTWGQSYDNVKEWIFSTWSTEDLKGLLKSSKIKFNHDASRSELVKLAQDRYDDIAKHHKASGKYPGDWLYSSWNDKSLKNWLKAYGVDYSPNASKEELSQKVRQYAYEASQYAEDQKESVLETLDLADKSLFDKAGSIRDDIFNTWSSLQLYNWLQAHRIEVEDSIKNNKAELALLAQKYKNDFKNDVESWTTKAQKKASPLLSKSSKQVDNLVNDTFFVGVEKWSKDRLKAFLNSRGVSIPLFATRYQLVELVKENKYKPIQNFNTDDFFQGWSKDNILKTLGVKNEDGSTVDFGAKASEFYNTLATNIGFYGNKVSGAADGAATAVANKGTEAKDAFFDYWSDVELRDYLASFGYKNTKNYRRDDLLNLVKQNTRWFYTGSQYDTNTNKLSSTVKLYSANLWSSILFKLRTWYNYVYYYIF